MRVTIDLDSWWFTDLQRIINKAYEIGLGFPDILRKSPRKSGYHLIWFNAAKSEEEANKLRRILEDDEKRVTLDEKISKKPKQVLFRKKKVFIIRRRRW